MKKLTPIFALTDLAFCRLDVPAINNHKADGSFNFTTEQQTYYGQSQTHPSIVYIPAGWNGHKWWMATTPYPVVSGHESAMQVFENPCIYYADDESGNPPRTWTPIAGNSNGVFTMTSNPIVRVNSATPFESGKTTVNSDPDLYFDSTGNGGAGRLYLISRENSNNFATYLQYSDDGQSWTPRPDRSTGYLWKQGVGECLNKPEFLSFGIQKVGSEIWAYNLTGRAGIEGVNARQNKGMCYGIWIMKATSMSGSWTYYRKGSFTGKVNIEPWHMDIFKDDATGYYYTVICAKDYDVEGTSFMATYLAESTDGLNFRIFSRPLTNSYNSYRPTAVIRGTDLVLYFSTQSGAPTDSASYPSGASVPVDGRAIGVAYKNFNTLLTSLRADEVFGWVN